MKHRWLGMVFLLVGILLMTIVWMWPSLQTMDPIYRIPLYFPALVVSAIGLYLFRISATPK